MELLWVNSEAHQCFHTTMNQHQNHLDRHLHYIYRVDMFIIIYH
jgi:hypothetical protein